MAIQYDREAIERMIKAAGLFDDATVRLYRGKASEDFGVPDEANFLGEFTLPEGWLQLVDAPTCNHDVWHEDEGSETAKCERVRECDERNAAEVDYLRSGGSVQFMTEYGGVTVTMATRWVLRFKLHSFGYVERTRVVDAATRLVDIGDMAAAIAEAEYLSHYNRTLADVSAKLHRKTQELEKAQATFNPGVPAGIGLTLDQLRKDLEAASTRLNEVGRLVFFGSEADD